MEKYTVSGFVFDTKEEALAAKKELKAIQTICQKLDVTKPKYAKAVHDRIIEKNMFHTIAGEEFLKSLESVYREETAKPQAEEQVILETAGTADAEIQVSEDDRKAEQNRSDAAPEPKVSIESEVPESDILQVKEPETDVFPVKKPQSEEAIVADEPVSEEIAEVSSGEPASEEPEIELEQPEQRELTVKETVQTQDVPASEEAVTEEQNNLFQQDIILDPSFFEEEEKPERQKEENEYISIRIDDDYADPEIHIEEESVKEAGDSLSLEAAEEQPEWKKQALEALYGDEDKPKKKKKEKKKKTEEDYQNFKDDYDLPQSEEEPEEEPAESRHYRGLFFNSFVLNIVLIAAIVFLILVAFNSENANILNYERVLNNRYEQKEQELEKEYESLRLELENSQSVQE